jgi:16S rRNA G966 N2-methylase RsmD
MYSKYDYNKLFPKYNNIKLKNLQIDDETLMYITMPKDSEKISMIISSHMMQYKSSNNLTIVDATACVGGDTITFCMNFENVISIEENIDTYKMLCSNIKQYDFKNITILNGDCTQIIPKLNNIDVVYIDPPWGGKDYKKKDNIILNIGSVTVEEFIDNCLLKNNNIYLFTLKLPLNYNFKNLKECMNEKFNIYIYRLYKYIIIVLETKDKFMFDLK